MPVRKRKITLSPDWRERIKIGVIMDRLNRHVAGTLEMSVTQISAAKLLLSKVAPDLRAIEHSGSIEHRNADELTDSELADIATGSRVRASKPKGSKEKSTRIH